MKHVLIGMIRLYRLLLSPWVGGQCRFHPTCSAYAIEALERHGAAAGTYLGAARILRCQPWCEGGHDPVPDRFRWAPWRRGPAAPDPADGAVPAPARTGETSSARRHNSGSLPEESGPDDIGAASRADPASPTS